MKASNYFLLFLSTLGALLVFALFLVWGVSLPNTALLWANGDILGWAYLLISATVSALFTFSLAFLIIDELKNNK